MGETTLLFTDIEGSTLMLEAAPLQYAETLGRHHEILRKLATEYGGSEFQDAGDGLWFAFQSPANAIHAALAMQARLASAEWAKETGMPRVRMAIHCADVEFRDGQYRGTAVHKTTRVLAACHGGQILALSSIKEAHFEGRGIKLTLLGTYSLKGFKKEESVFQVDKEDSIKAFPPLKADHARRHNLPLANGSFFGRSGEIKKIAAIFRRKSGGNRLVTLTGPAGIGKTSLSLAVARRLLRNYDNGVIFVPLQNVSKVDEIFHAILTALEVTPDLVQHPLEQINRLLRGMPTLMVLDNFEQLLAEGALIVHQLLAKIPSLQLLVTSRLPLGLAGEHKFSVHALPVPPVGETSAGVIQQFDSVRFFIERMNQSRPDCYSDEIEIFKIAEICRILDGVPLALELAAARTKIFATQELAEALRVKFSIFDTDALHEDRTLEIVFDWSVHLLPPDIANFFFTLSVFVGGWTTHTAAEVHGVNVELARGYIHYLLTCSLIHAKERGDDIRFEMLGPIRKMAVACLNEQRLREVYRSHSNYFCGLLRKNSTTSSLVDHEYLYDLIESEINNILAAIEREPSNENRLFAAIDLHQYALFGICNRHVRKLLTSFRSEGGEIKSGTLARAWHSAGILDLMVNDLESARLALLRAIPLFEELGETDSLMKARYNLAIVEQRRMGNDSEAFRISERTLAYFQGRNAMEECAAVLQKLSNDAYKQGRLDQAYSCLEECLDLCRRNQNLGMLATALSSLGEVQLTMNDPWGAWMSLFESVMIKIRLGHYLGLANNFYLFAKFAWDAGDYETASFFLSVIRGLATKYRLRFSRSHLRTLQQLEKRCREEVGDEIFQREEERGRKSTVAEWVRAMKRVAPLRAISPPRESVLLRSSHLPEARKGNNISEKITLKYQAMQYGKTRRKLPRYFKSGTRSAE